MEQTRVLGPLCKRGHDHDGTGHSLRYASTRQCVECHNEWQRQYYAKAPERLRAYARGSYHRTRDKRLKVMATYRKTQNFKDAARKSRQVHKADIKGRMEKWRAKNKEHIKRSYRAWAQSPRGKSIVSILTSRRRARKRVAHVPYTPADVQARFADFAQSCAYCNQSATTMDHVVPLAQGGHDALYNLVPACRPCNSSKGNRDMFAWFSQRATFSMERLGAIVNVLTSL